MTSQPNEKDYQRHCGQKRQLNLMIGIPATVLTYVVEGELL